MSRRRFSFRLATLWRLADEIASPSRAIHLRLPRSFQIMMVTVCWWAQITPSSVLDWADVAAEVLGAVTDFCLPWAPLRELDLIL